jgi:hypothetical protein
MHERTSQHAETEFENKRLREELQKIRDSVPTDGAHLIVNGQVRTIGKKSQYLLDMLTLPEDK